MIRAKLAQLLTLAALRQQLDATLDHARGRNASATVRTCAAGLLFRAAAAVCPEPPDEAEELSAIEVDPTGVGEEEGHRRALSYIVAASRHAGAGSHLVGLASTGALEWGGPCAPRIKVGMA